MPKPFSEFTSQFFWDFKRMDNVNYNFKIVETLYAAKKNYPFPTSSFNKPIIIFIMAIIECSLYDLLIRINQYRNDPFPNITAKIVSYLRKSKETDQLNAIIPKIKSQNLLRSPDGVIYDDLEYLRKVRNRIHIQNKYNELDRDEHRIFTNAELIKAQECLEKVYEVLCNTYPRGKQPIPMAEFPRPWL